MKLRFFKQGDKWYADVPNHTLEDNEMVYGSDVLLENLSHGNDEVVLNISLVEVPDYLLKLDMREHDDDGAYYIVSGPLFNQYVESNTVNYCEDYNVAWICNVTHDVFGEHPKEIYIIGIEI